LETESTKDTYLLQYYSSNKAAILAFTQKFTIRALVPMEKRIAQITSTHAKTFKFTLAS